MMLLELQILSFALALFQIPAAFAVSGYHYDRPVQSILPLTQRIPKTDGHQFVALPTISPLPPVPAIPPLPTGRPSSHVSSQSLVQIHPPPKDIQTASRSIANAYRPANTAQFQTTYVPPNGGLPFPNLSNQAQSQPKSLDQILFGHRIQSAAPSLVVAPQPLSIPFGKQALVHLVSNPSSGPSNGDDFSYELGGRKLKQYAVVEIIDNDIEQNMRPFLTTPFIDNYRARIGASGTGAAPLPLGQQIESRSSALVMEQQRLKQSQGPSDAIALGSGGLGFVRLANGNVYLGSGSLGYISGQQHSALLQEARTRKGASMPDPLHFGHGALGNPGNAGSFRF